MGGAGAGSMSSSPKIEYLPATENDDGSMGVDISSLSSSENPDIVSASVNFVARYYRSKNKELRVKVPREYFSFFAPLWQMGFNIIEHAESTYIILREDKSCTILRANDLHKIPLGVTRMQRENFASSSNPCNLIYSQNSDATLAIQTPSKTSCVSNSKWVATGSGDEQGLDFQQSNQAFLLGPASMGNDNKVVGLEDLFVGFELPKYGVQTKKRLLPANKSSELPLKRTRGPDFEAKAKGLLLRFKLEFLQDLVNKGHSHAWLLPVTGKMKDNGYDRDPMAWRGLWDTLKKNCDAMKRRFPQDTGYWDLTEVEKSAIRQIDKHFPLTFEPEWVVAMENIWKMKPRRDAKKHTRRDGQEGVFSQSLTSTIIGSTNFASASSSDANIQASVQHLGQVSVQGSDEDLLGNSQRLGALPSCIQDYLSFSHSLREKDYHEISVTIQEQVAVQREDVQLTRSALKKSMENSSSDSLEFFDYDGCSNQNSLLPLVDANLVAGCNELENHK